MSNYDEFLKQCLTKYKNPDLTMIDVSVVFTTFNDLRPKFEPFYFNDGTKKNLLQLDGTIPVSYRGGTYNIPISIWIMHRHPYNPPMVYVKPTTTMQIKCGRNVDMNGKIDLPYLRNWEYPQSDLLGFIQILTIVFGEEPPVYSRDQDQRPRDCQTKILGANGSNVVSTARKSQVSGQLDTTLAGQDSEDLDIECDTCRVDDTIQEAEAFCANCKEYFCQECLKYHRRMTATRNHKIFKRV